uniref:Testis specific 13 n=1 Tax=Latimeria chalumnae TaxID=7897 RepID=M3XHM5_LATCH|nr:PREDICTED: testis-specific gene 13 protein [Latimeria chalumnae]|eukprot:XP_014346329.1 PREDICTED: testis-specific gene 13 protein [Latimeria chalumnae]
MQLWMLPLTTNSKLPSLQLQKSISNYRKNLGLMYRASETNQDKASLIIANNPLPDLNDLEGKDSPMRYLSLNPLDKKQAPSALPPPMSYKRHLPRTTKDSSNVIHWGDHTGKKWRCRFLTEDSLKCDGQFSKQFAKKRKEMTLPQPNVVSSYALNLKKKYTQNELESRYSKDSDENSHGRRTTWEPLTLDALMETKAVVTAPGERAFKCGQTQQWVIGSTSRKLNGQDT